MVKGFRLAVTQFHSFAAALECSRKDNLSLVFRSTPLLMTFQFILDIGTVLLMILGAGLLLNGSISLFVWLIFLILALRMYEPIKALGPVYEITQSAEATLDRIEAILSEKPQVHGCSTLPPGLIAINFKNVSFAYNDNIEGDGQVVVAGEETGGGGRPGARGQADRGRAHDPTVIAAAGSVRASAPRTRTGSDRPQRWQAAHQNRRRPAAVLSRTGEPQRRQGRPVRW